jgi:predicted DNA-binding transcriptional regulator AlpA
MTEPAMLTARAVQKRYGISAMTVWRWEHDERLGFPAPTIIRGRRYWRGSELEAWERSQPTRRFTAERHVARG